MIRKGILSFGILLSAATASATMLPPNDLHLEDNLYRKDANMTEARFLELSNQVIDYYRPIVEAHGSRLRLNADWRNSEVNASAHQSFGTWNVNMFGGLARRPEVTEDGYVLVVCHELGHHLAGFPAKGSFNSWAANEGQSDYFAGQACARNVWQDDIELNATFRQTANPAVKVECDAAWQDEAAQNLCYRIVEGGYSISSLLGSVSHTGKDTRVVTRTYSNHPKSQCRYDTYKAGALCDVDFNDSLIPRTASQVKATSCVRSNGFEESARPLCWYKP